MRINKPGKYVLLEDYGEKPGHLPKGTLIEVTEARGYMATGPHAPFNGKWLSVDMPVEESRDSKVNELIANKEMFYLEFTILPPVKIFHDEIEIKTNFGGAHDLLCEMYKVIGHEDFCTLVDDVSGRINGTKTIQQEKKNEQEIECER